MIFRTYQVSGANIVFEEFDEEVVVVNLDSGKYYSIRKIGAFIWKAIIGSHTLEAITNTIQQQHPSTSEDISVDISEFVSQLLSEGLVKPAQNEVNESPLSPPLGAYSAPSIEVFSDMQEILLLDPVHDVDESGWPVTEPQSDNK